MAEPIERLRSSLRQEVRSLESVCQSLNDSIIEYEGQPSRVAHRVEIEVERLQKVAFHLAISIAEFNFRARSEQDGVSGDG